MAAAVWRASIPRTPVYEGRTVQEWQGEVFTTNQAKAMTVLRGMGPEAMPALIQSFQKRDSAWGKLYERNYPRLPASARRHLPRPLPAQVLWSSAELVLLNNPNGRKVVPQLVDLLKEKDSGARKYVMGAVVHWVRPGDREFVPALTECLRDPDPTIRKEAAYALERLRPHDTVKVPAVPQKAYNGVMLERNLQRD
jgi:hypothetical protein